MQDYPCMETYFDTLFKLAASKKASLKQAFIKAGVPDSTYYRAEQGRDLRYATAKKVFDYLDASKKQTHKKEAEWR